MNIKEICEKLNTLKRYDEVEGRDFHRTLRVEQTEYGDYVKLEDVAALFNLMADTYMSENFVREKVLPNH